MTSRTFATRMTCFSLISAIETDLRNLICKMDSILNVQIPDDVNENAISRFEGYFKEKFKDEEGLSNLIEFSDFSDLAKVLSKNKNSQSLVSVDEVKQVVKGLESLVHVRNRICHSRPLEYNDINDLTDFAVELKKLGEHHWWGGINEALENLNNPSFALSLQIPSYWKSTNSTVFNNLPLPEFDDTGFLGRKEERSSVSDLINSHTRVISLVGEGGVGKTALALRCLYDVLELSEGSSNSQSDMIIWVTLKADRLTASGVIQLRDAIVSTLGLYQNIGKALGVSPDSSIEEILEEISIYMKEFKILLCIDNLETIDKQSVRSFLAEIPQGSKILITTRIGLGEIEYRYKLDSLDGRASVDLIRKLSRLLNIEYLKKKNKASLESLAQKLHHNPLLIKWYVLGLGSGKRTEDLLNKESVSYQEALKFCFQNLYERLEPTELDIIKTIACLRNSVSAVELRFILEDRNELEIAEALHNLNNSSMLKSNMANQKEDDGIKTYTLTNIANDYLTTVSPISDEFYAGVKQKHRQLKRHIESSLNEHNHYHLDITNVHAENKDEQICAVYLKQAMSLARQEESFEQAVELISKAKAMKPDFSECYRVNAYIHQTKSPFKAEAEYEAAIEYNPNSVISYYGYSQYLMGEEDYPYAIEQIDKALGLKPDDEALLSFKALILTRSGEYSEAIKLYEHVLPVQRENQHRKFRISTYQQLISAYKRYSERLIVDNDYPKSAKILQRIFELFEEAYENDNYDERAFGLFGQIIALSDKVDFKLGNVTYTTKAIEILDRYREGFSVHHKIKLCSSVKSVLDKIFTSSKVRLEILCRDLESIEVGEGEYFHGALKDVVCKAHNNVSYGFIVGDDGIDYFFHRGELNPTDVLDNNEEYRGLRVGFTVCPDASERGPVAKGVHLI